MELIMNLKTLSIALAGVLAGAVNAASVEAQTLQENTPGSFLVFAKFDIRGETTTQYRIVNNEDQYARVKLNYVCPGVKFGDDRCRALDRTVDFTPHQTRVIDVADQNPPCNQGYAVAYVRSIAPQAEDLSNSATPAATSYNALTGSYSINSGRRVEAENAFAVSSLAAQGASLGSGSPVSFTFGGDYEAMPSNLYTDFRSVAFGSEGGADVGSRLTLLSLDVLAGAQNPPVLANIDFWAANEEPFSTSLEFICWTEVQLDSIDANFLQDNLGTSHGSMKITPVGNCPVTGTCPPLPLYDATILGSIVEYGDGDVGGRALAHDRLPKVTAYRPR